jgi:ATP-dependent helicase/nuclease subunit B
MAVRTPRVYTIQTGVPFLECLAGAILNGFPDGRSLAPSDIARYTILLPTRRAARRLEQIFFEAGGGRGMLLPRIRPIGDIDEEFLEDILPDGAEAPLPDAISRMGRQFILIDLIEKWAKANPVAKLAQEIAASPHQTINLANSLASLVDGFETEEIDQSRMPGLYDIESARHREAILEFLALVRERLPAILHAKGMIGPMARRSMMIRREARRLTEINPPWPVIAAGSTGSIPATRELLAAISRLPSGAVVLPGLDAHLDDESWESVREQHPQFALKQLLGSLGITRGEVSALHLSEAADRDWLVSEVMRPPETAETWTNVIATGRDRLAASLRGVELIESRGLREEAQIIALIMRATLEINGKTASLVTPDRQLARRVKQELAQLGVSVDDSAGEPLMRFGGASFVSLVIDAVLGEFPPEQLVVLLKHDLSTFGFAPEIAHRIAGLLDLAVFRANFSAPTIDGLRGAVHRARQSLEQDSHSSPAIRAYTEHDWQDAAEFAEQVSNRLRALSNPVAGSFRTHLELLVETCQAAAGERLWEGDAGFALKGLIEELQNEGAYLESCSFRQALEIVRNYLAVTPLRAGIRSAGRLSILGLLEARLANPDVMILGGLNEGRWPAQPDPGPWLNRPMRAILGMQQPERELGQTAHDFAQALGGREVYLVWSRQMADAPAIPSRWMLRLQMLKAACEIGQPQGNKWQSLAAGMFQPEAPSPCKRPSPKPPVEARPRRLSVTRIETLIRDPYAIYARYVLDLEPLREIAARPDSAERGTIFHQAIGDFLQKYPERLPPQALEELLDCGRRRFADLRSDPDIGTFWWAQFERIARWFADNETSQRRGVLRVFAEAEGRLDYPVAGRPFTLTCRADRIDLLDTGEARIADYKTGSVPTGPQVISGLAPQLTLEAAMLARGAFQSLGAWPTSELVYIKLGGGDPPGDWRPPKLNAPLAECVARSFNGFMDLLTGYANLRQAYLPRTIVEHEDEKRDYDHLSRFREWALSGAVA